MIIQLVLAIATWCSGYVLSDDEGSYTAVDLRNQIRQCKIELFRCSMKGYDKERDSSLNESLASCIEARNK